MPNTTARMGITSPLGTEAPNVDLHMKNIADQVDAVAAMYGQGTFAARPVSTPGSPGKAGRFYVVTSGAELGQVYYDYGTGWIYINPPPTTPGAGSIGTTELATDAVTQIKVADNAIGTAEVIDGSIGFAELANALKPSAGAGAATEALRALGMGSALALSQAQITSINRQGTFASRPAANTVVAGTTYFATDLFVQYISDGAAWTQIGSAFTDPATTLPGSPVDKQRAILIDSLTTPTYAWEFQYETGISDANKWLFCGGSSQRVQDATLSENTGGFQVFSGGTLNVPRAGIYEIQFGAACSSSASGGNYIGLAVAGPSVASIPTWAAGTIGVSSAAGFHVSASLAANTAIQLIGRSGDTNLVTFNEGWIAIRPVRVA